MERNYVIIGNSAAAVGAVEAIRKIDPSGSVTMVTDEKHHTYSRPLISYLLEGKTDEEKMKYRPDDFYEKNHIRLLFDRAERIRPEEHTVELKSGTSLKYDRLLCATGSSPFVPPIEGLETVKDVFTFLKLDDAKALEQALSPEKEALIVGAGLIGLKCAEGIAGKVKKITVVDLAPRILSSILDEEGAALMQEHLEQNGLRFVLNAGVGRLERDRAVLSDGREIPFDLLVLAVGVRPNIGLIRDAGGEIQRGIVTDDTMKTSLPDIYAAGDCTQSWDISSGTSKILALLPNAYLQGECAGRNMAGEEAHFQKAIPMNSMGLFGKHIITAGTYAGKCVSPEGEGYKKLFLSEDDRLVGYILIGDIDRAGIYTRLIREQIPLSTVDFPLIAQHPCLMALGQAKFD